MKRSNTRRDTMKSSWERIPICREYFQYDGVERKTVSLSPVNRVALRRELYLADQEELVGTVDREDTRRDCGRARAVLFGRLMSRESGRPNLA